MHGQSFLRVILPAGEEAMKSHYRDDPLPPAPPAVLPAKCPSAYPRWRGLPPIALRCGANARHRPAAWRQRCPCRADEHANGPLSRGQRQIAPPPPGSSIRYRSLPKSRECKSIECGCPIYPSLFRQQRLCITKHIRRESLPIHTDRNPLNS